jgi:hypothetical protein
LEDGLVNGTLDPNGNGWRSLNSALARGQMQDADQQPGEHVVGGDCPMCKPHGV